MKSVLLLDEPKNSCLTMASSLRKYGCSIIATSAIDDARKIVAREEIDLIITNVAIGESVLSEIADLAKAKGIRTFGMSGRPVARSVQPTAARTSFTMPAAEHLTSVS